MKMQSSNDLVAELPEAPQTVFPTFLDRYFLQLRMDGEVSWNSTTVVAFLMLVLFWAFRMYSTWATWGNLSIDSGREMYVPSVLLKGKTLYRDVWYLYGPAAPYFNSYLFRLFGTRLEVLYWAGSLSALACAALLFLSGKRLLSWPAGWTAGAVILMQAFQPGLFCFPLAYSFSSVYGCVVSCLFLYIAIRASDSTHWGWILGAGTTAAAAMLLKLEYGAACYAALLLLVAARYFQHRSWKLTARDIVMTLPGIVVCGVVIGWMVSIAGEGFITQENMMSWPTSFFMKTYGKMWLEHSGFNLNAAAFGQAALRAGFYSGVVLEAYCLLCWKRLDPRSLYVRMGLFLIILGYYAFYLGLRPQSLLSAIFFPRDMVLYICAASLLAWWHFWRHPGSDGALALALLLIFSGLLAFRILLKMSPDGYAIYYDGPAVLSFLLLACTIVPRSGRSRRSIFLGKAGVCLSCLTAVVLASPWLNVRAANYVPLVTDRGTVVVEKRVAENYQAAIPLMKETASHGEYVLSVPEDTSLYFLSGVDCPTRVFAFTPGVISPGKMMDELIQEIERKPIRYLIWSNRTFSEYGVAGFGIDFDQQLGNYLKTHYHRIGLMVPKGQNVWELTFVLWERNPTDVRP